MYCGLGTAPDQLPALPDYVEAESDEHDNDNFRNQLFSHTVDNVQNYRDDNEDQINNLNSYLF